MTFLAAVEAEIVVDTILTNFGLEVTIDEFAAKVRVSRLGGLLLRV